jgi:energy-converting hydrogenase Eha subunit F
MKNIKKVALALLLLLGAAAAIELAPAQAAPRPDPCAGVRCMACPEGTVFSPKPGNCCRCVPA